VEQEFLKAEHLESLLVEESLEQLLSRLKAWEPRIIEKW
jgi:hypothetical protein